MTTRVQKALLAFATITLVFAASPPVHASVGSELVWADGVQWEMTVPPAVGGGITSVSSAENFFVIAPQTANHQSVEVGGDPPFHHDHVIPAQAHNAGSFNAHWHVFVVLCSATGMSSGNCVATMTSGTPFGTIPLAKTVNGHMLTSVGPIEDPANSGFITLVDTHIVFVCPIHPVDG